MFKEADNKHVLLVAVPHNMCWKGLNLATRSKDATSGTTTRNKKLLKAKGIAIRSKELGRAGLTVSIDRPEGES